MRILTFLLLIATVALHAQFNEWVWMHGSNNPLHAGTYGTQGIPNIANMPPARYESGEWTDMQGNLWIFGGGTSGNQVFNDLWKYDPVTNMWTWMKGNSTLDPPAVYGIRSVAAATNTPGGREFAPATWIDLNGNLWMFGGDGYDSMGTRGNLSDLWKYDITTNTWTWIAGPNIANQPPVYGIQGVSAASNNPGPRTESSCTWTDNNNNLWLFGGIGLDNTGNIGRLNDLWKYDPVTNMWTWMSGSSIRNQTGIYGTLGIGAATNIPGGRSIYTSWIDNSGNLWLYAGDGYDAIGVSGQLNDLWKYDISTNVWTWIDGANTVGQTRSYGTKCVAAVGNGPSNRFEARARWKDECGNFYLFGGGIGSSFGFSNDMWRYNPNSNLWTWVSGDNVTYQAGVYGTLGTPAPNNKPGSRMGCNGFKNNDGFWIFGGLHLFTYMNDLWKYIPDKPTAFFVPDTTSGCIPLTINFTDMSLPNCNEIKSYAWDFGDPFSGINNTSSNANPSHTFVTAGTYNIKLAVTSCTGSKDSIIQTITALPQPVINSSGNTSICSGNSVMLTASGVNTYWWFPSSGLSSTTGSNVTALPTGTSTYSVIGVDNNSCKDTSSILITVISLPNANAGNDTSICLGQSATLIASGGAGYVWNTGATIASLVISPSLTSVYTVTVSNGNCGSMDSVTVTVDLLPVVDAGANVVITPGSNTILSPSGGQNCTWLPASGLSCINCCNPMANPNRTTTYYLTITDTNGCISTDSVIVYVNELFVPTAFSPNGDGQNDVLLLKGFGVKQLYFVIYDRWGEVVFETNDLTIGWDGTYKGKLMNTAVFVYQLNAKMPDGREINQMGNLYLVR